jgi:hypothetical protein
MPIFPPSDILEPIGFRKVWDVTKEHRDELTYAHMIKDGDSYLGYEINWKNFNLQCLNCFMICFISLQTEIFKSPGYQKFITQKSGSMDLIMSLADKKAKSLAYCFNNDKIRNIVSIQRRKETIMTTVEKLKDKLKRWRMFMRTTLTDDKKRLLKHSESTDSQVLDPSPKRDSTVLSSNIIKLNIPEEETKEVIVEQRDTDTMIIGESNVVVADEFEEMDDVQQS